MTFVVSFSSHFLTRKRNLIKERKKRKLLITEMITVMKAQLSIHKKGPFNYYVCINLEIFDPLSPCLHLFSYERPPCEYSQIS